MINHRQVLLIKIISTIMLFFAAINYENALKTRVIVYLALFTMYILLNILRFRLKNKTLLVSSFLIEIIIISLLEYNSRYQVNYIFHIFYFLILLEIPIRLDKTHSLIVSLFTLIISNVKFIRLLYLKPTFGNISQGGFFLLTGIFIALLMNFLKYYKEEEERKKILNNELREANIRLNEMTILEERNRIARDLHDTIGHGLTGTIMGLEMVQVLLDEDMDQAKRMIKDLKEGSRESLVKVREVVSALNPDENISNGIESINQLISSFKKQTNVDISFNIYGEVKKTSPATNIVLYRIVQEGLTNAVRHGKANKIIFKITFKDKSLDLYIKDNGIGSKEVNKGFGLKSMEDRVLSIGGTISFLSLNGFSIVANIPLEVYHD